jgi:hypothetical protein
MLSISLYEIVESQDALLFLKAGTGRSSYFYLGGDKDFFSSF